MKNHQKRPIHFVFGMLAAVVTISAILSELRKPPDQRLWHGAVLGFVPYDFRKPTLERIRNSYWNPESDRVVTNRVFGVGWGINIPVLFRQMREASQQISA